VLAHGLEEGWAFVCLDGTLIASTRSGARSEAGHDVWYSGEHKRHGGNIQVLTDPTGFPVWTSEVEPSSTHDIAAAREHALPALYPAAARGPADPDRQGLHRRGHRHHGPTNGRNLAPDNQARNGMIGAPRAGRTRQHPAQTDLEST
jgi:hypothetical protein